MEALNIKKKARERVLSTKFVNRMVDIAVRHSMCNYVEIAMVGIIPVTGRPSITSELMGKAMAQYKKEVDRGHI